MLKLYKDSSDYSESCDESEPRFLMGDGEALCLLCEDVNSEPKLEDKLVVDYNFGQLIFEDEIHLPEIGPAWKKIEEFPSGIEVKTGNDLPVDCFFIFWADS